MKHLSNLEDIIVAVVFILYLLVALSHAYKSNWPWFIVWASYAMANLGLILATHTK